MSRKDFLMRLPGEIEATADWSAAIRGGDVVEVHTIAGEVFSGVMRMQAERGFLFMQLRRQHAADGDDWVATGNTDCEMVFLPWSSVELVKLSRKIVIKGTPFDDK